MEPETKLKKTPTPWREDNDFFGIVDADGEGICEYTSNDDGIHWLGDSKEKILRAVNSHGALLELVEAITEGVEINNEFMAACKQVIAQADDK